MGLETCVGSPLKYSGTPTGMACRSDAVCSRPKHDGSNVSRNGGDRPSAEPVTPFPDALGARILVVDDERFSGESVAGMLTDLGHQPTVATDWASALDSFNARTDLVLLDLVMPGVDGLKLAALMRERSESYVPIVFLTGRSDDESKERALLAGGDDFLVKPVSRLELRVRVTAMLRIRRLTQRLHARAHVDPLTSVGNRRAFDEALQRRCAESTRYRRSFSLVLLDVDYFKQVNDTYGHAVGDEVLMILADVLRDGVRSTDQLFRYGGEEFAVLAPETEIEGALTLAERLRVGFRLATRRCPAGRQTLSAGVASTNGTGAFDRRRLLKAADDALYRAKGAGRDRVMAADPVSRLKDVSG